MNKAKYLDMIERRNKEKNRSKNKMRTPEVGIIYFIGGELYIDSTPVKEAEKYGDLLIHPKSHLAYWEKELSYGKSPIRPIARGKDYDFYPRGRVAYEVPKGTYVIYLDKCIIDLPDIVKQIVFLLHLPETKCEVSRDRHYQCSVCNPDYAK